MRNAGWLVIILITTITLSGCITVELKDERTIPKFYEVVMITYTPEGMTLASPTASSLPPTTTRTSTPAATFTASPTHEDTATPTTVSPTPDPLAVVVMNAFCRQGPGTYYPATQDVTAGEKVNILGRNPSATWWLVQNADGDACWVFASVVQIPNGLLGISVLSVPPTPRPTYTPSPTLTPVRRPRRDSPATTGTEIPQATDTPDPYPYPAP